MKKIALTAAAASFAITVSACGSYTDASEEAKADNVELPADEAMAGAPEPVADDAGVIEDASDAVEAAEAAQDVMEEDAAE